MIQSHFNNLAKQICFQLSKATQSIHAAVCWFSHNDIFEVIKNKQRVGVQVELLLEYDSQNIKNNGLDFQHFINLGGALFAYCGAGLMHQKFAIVDDKLLLTGSFNWTYNSNAENVLVTEEPRMVASFQREFERQRGAAKRIFTINREEVKLFSAFPIFENTSFTKVDLKKNIACGCTVWIVRSDKMKYDESNLIHKCILPFDPQLLLTNFWNTTRLFDQELFENSWKTISCGLPSMQARALRLFTCRMKTGDIVLLVWKKKQLQAIGGLILSWSARF